MMDKKSDLVVTDQSIFEQSKQTDPQGRSFWSARDLWKILQYSEYRQFLPVIAKAKKACLNSGHNPDGHFISVQEQVAIGSGAIRDQVFASY